MGLTVTANQPAGKADPTKALVMSLCHGELDASQRQRAIAALAQPIDWEQFVRLVQLHDIAPLVWRNMARLEANTQIPPEVRQQLEATARQTMLDGSWQLAQSAWLIERLQSAGFSPVVLKGFAVGDLVYSDPVLRATSDLDLLLPHADLPAALSFLQISGFQLPPPTMFEFYLANGYHISTLGSVLGQPLKVELHWDLAPRRIFPLDIGLLMRRAQPFSLNQTRARRLSVEDTLLHLVLHIRKHRYVGLRWLNDIAELLSGFDATLDWPYVLHVARQAGIGTVLYTAAVLAQSLLQASVDEQHLAALRPSALRRWVIRAILPKDLLAVPDQADKEGWTRLAPVEVLMLDRPSAMWRELRFRLAPPLAGMLGPSALALTRRQRLDLTVRRLLDRTRTLLRRR
mgnify:CR=1 FL=1